MKKITEITNFMKNQSRNLNQNLKLLISLLRWHERENQKNG